MNQCVCFPKDCVVFCHVANARIVHTRVRVKMQTLVRHTLCVQSGQWTDQFLKHCWNGRARLTWWDVLFYVSGLTASRLQCFRRTAAPLRESSSAISFDAHQRQVCLDGDISWVRRATQMVADELLGLIRCNYESVDRWSRGQCGHKKDGEAAEVCRVLLKCVSVRNICTHGAFRSCA